MVLCVGAHRVAPIRVGMLGSHTRQGSCALIRVQGLCECLGTGVACAWAVSAWRGGEHGLRGVHMGLYMLGSVPAGGRLCVLLRGGGSPHVLWGVPTSRWHLGIAVRWTGVPSCRRSLPLTLIPHGGSHCDRKEPLAPSWSQSCLRQTPQRRKHPGGWARKGLQRLRGAGL